MSGFGWVAATLVGVMVGFAAYGMSVACVTALEGAEERLKASRLRRMNRKHRAYARMINRVEI